MSQAEANEVMELWTRRQREDAERQAMVTVHDVAEATQLSPQEIQRLLQDVRASRPELPKLPQNHRPGQIVHDSEASVALKVLPYTAIPAVGMIFINSFGPFFAARLLLMGSVFWIVGLIGFYTITGFARLRNDAKQGRALRQSSSGFDQRF